MCILCVIQKWSRKVATMLPWLVIPLIGLWLLSQFLPPAFRFEITSPRLACVLVLLATLFWYEILMPQLSSWRARRNARLKEKKRLEALEMKKLRKTATRRCRNCKTPYRDQNPAGGKFMCSYCGHSSKRPLFDPSVSSGLEQSGVLKDLVGKVWSGNSWICGQDWLENGGYWVNGSVSGKSSYLKKNIGGFNSGNNHFFLFLIVCVCKCLIAIFLALMWPFRKLFRISFSEDEDSTDNDINGLAKKGENGVNCNETRSEKARRKAEEKRQARLEREQLEEEERKQREEVARLVEERRKLRDEIDKKIKASTREKNDKTEVERKRQERKKEKDRGSSKSNSDADELEKRANKEIERKLKGDVDSREHHKSNVMTNNYNKGGVGARYLDRMRGSFFPSSQTITGGFFGKGVNAKANANNTREHKSSAYLDHSNKRDFVQPERAHVKSNAHADDQSQKRPAVFESQPCPPPKRSWHQLFTRSSPPVSSPITNVISRPNPNENPQTELHNSIPSSGHPVTQGFDNSVSYGLPFPPLFMDSTINTNTDVQFSAEQRVHREPEIYEDPCFVADPISLAGPVSDPLDNFPIDLGFLTDVGTSDEKHVSPRTREKTNLPVEDHGGVNDKGWQMWDSTFSPDSLGLVSGNANWSSPQKTTTASNDPWALRTSHGSISSNINNNNNNLSMNLHENELLYEILNGSVFNYPFQPSNGTVWAKKEKGGGGGGGVEGIGSTSGLIGPPLQMYSPFGNMNEKEKQG